MKSIISKMSAVMEWIFGLAGIVMICVATYGVFARNILKVSAPWTDEFLKLLFVWTIFVCSALAFASDEMISLTLVEDSEKAGKSPALYGALKVIQYMGSLIVGALLSSQLVTIIGTQISTGEASTVMKYPLWTMNLGVFIGVLLIMIISIAKLIGCIKYFKKKES